MGAALLPPVPASALQQLAISRSLLCSALPCSRCSALLCSALLALLCSTSVPLDLSLLLCSALPALRYAALL